jgi:tetratricopeptide (TPR) repeat protein
MWRWSLVPAMLLAQSCTMHETLVPPATESRVPLTSPATPTRAAPLTQSEMLTLLNSDQFPELDRRYSALQRDYKKGTITDESLRAAFRVFYATDDALGSKYDAWVAQFPKSYVARLARGIYYKKVAEDRRGGDFISNTTDEQLLGMETFFAKASEDLYASIALDDKPLLSYVHAMDIGAFLGNPGESRRLLDLSLQLDPGNFVAREKYLNFLEPRWGGSVEQMYAFLEECKKAQLSAAHLRSLEGIIVADDAARYNEAGDFAAAERGYRKAMAMGRDECLPCLAYVLIQQEKFEAAIPLYSTMLLADPADIVALANRAFAYMRTGKIREAIEDWTAAASHGDAYSQNELGQLDMTGVPGVMPANPQAGIDWFRKAAAQGNPAAIQNLNTLPGMAIRKTPSEAR